MNNSLIGGCLKLVEESALGSSASGFIVFAISLVQYGILGFIDIPLSVLIHFHSLISCLLYYIILLRLVSESLLYLSIWRGSFVFISPLAGLRRTLLFVLLYGISACGGCAVLDYLNF